VQIGAKKPLLYFPCLTCVGRSRAATHEGTGKEGREMEERKKKEDEGSGGSWIHNVTDGQAS